MKSILFYTDLSPEADAAARHAASQASAANARLIVLYAYATEPRPADEEQETEVAAQARLDDLAQRLHQEFNISVTRLLKPAFKFSDIASIAGQVKADQIILSSDFSGQPATTTALQENSALLSA